MNYNPHPNHVQHDRQHPDVHFPWHQWSEEETLHLATAYSNPYRWKSRRENFNNFRRHINSLPNIKLHVGELAYGDRPFEVTDPNHPFDYQFRSETALFHKENILNKVIERFPSSWKNGGYCDGDFTFTRQDVGLETIHQLQHHPWVQPFSSYGDLSGKTYGTGQRLINTNNSFAFNYINSGYQLPIGFTNGGWKTILHNFEAYDKLSQTGEHPDKTPQIWPVGATGGAWCFTRAGFNAVDGLLDVCILGHGDWFMTFGLVGHEGPDMHGDKYSQAYKAAIGHWQNKAAKLNKNIGYVDCFAVHHFHGSKNKRGYSSRDLILVKNQFDPVKDLRRNYQGIYEIDDANINLRNDIRSYFVSRGEDDPNLYNGK